VTADAAALDIPQGTTIAVVPKPPTMGRTPIRATWLRPARDAVIGACLLLAVIHLLGLTQIGGDAYSYWLANPLDPYHAATPGAAGAYFYSPAFAQALWPFHAWSWEVFITLTTIALTAALVWQAGLWTAPLFLLVPYIPIELMYGNIHLLMGAAIVLGFRWPATWSFVLLTKVTPGIGLLWFAARREWRSLAIALGATVGIAAASFLLAPQPWWTWAETLVAASSAGQPGYTIGIPLPIRLVAAAGLVLWGARANHRWTVVVASTIALPELWLNGLAMLVGVIPLLTRELGPTPGSRFLDRQPDLTRSATPE
jgi:hypothetical protein